jgi:hypothetical protein
MPRYEVNISKHGFHYARHTIKSTFSDAEALDQYEDVVNRFPPTEGFSCQLTKWVEEGRVLAAIPRKL